MTYARGVKRLVVLLVLLLAEGAAFADDQFWVHAEVGPGWVSMQDRYGSYTATASGMSLGLAVGGRVKPKLLVYAAIGGTFGSSPTFDFSGSTFTTQPEDKLSSTSVGFGLLYEPKPGLYLGGGITSQHLRLEAPSAVSPVDRGLGLGISIRVGKEWKVGKHVLLGGMLRIEGAGNETSEYSQSVTDLALLFTGSYH